MSLREAEEAVVSGPPAHALVAIDRALNVSRTDTLERLRLLDLRAATLETLGDIAGATTAGREMIAVAPLDARGYLRLGKVLRLGGDAERAACVYRAGIAAVKETRARAALQRQLARTLAPRGAAIDIFSALPVEVGISILKAMHHAGRWALLASTRHGALAIPHVLSVDGLLRVRLPSRPTVSHIDSLHPSVLDVLVSTTAAFESLLRSKRAQRLRRIVIVNTAVPPLPAVLPFSSLKSLRCRAAHFHDARSLLAALSLLPALEDLRFDKCSCRTPLPQSPPGSVTMAVKSLHLISNTASFPTADLLSLFRPRSLACNVPAFVPPPNVRHIESHAGGVLRRRAFICAGATASSARTAVVVDGPVGSRLCDTVGSLPLELHGLYVCSSTCTIPDLASMASRFAHLTAIGLVVRGNVSAAFCGLDGTRAVEALLAAAPRLRVIVLPALDLLSRASLSALQSRFPDVRIITSPVLSATIISRGFKVPRDL